MSAGRSSALAVAVCLGSVCGCQAHGTAGAHLNAGTSGNVEASGSANGEVQADAEAHADAKAEEAAHFRIRFVAGKLVQGRENADPRVFFALNKSDLVGDDTFKTLTLVRDYLREHPDMKVSVEGHTDARASDAYNLLLSRQRAGSVKGWLVNHGIAADRVTSVGYGEGHLKNKDDPNAAENRRVEFIVKEGAPAKDDPADARFVPKAAPEPVAAAEPTPAAPPVAPESVNDCGDPRMGFNVSAGGPRSYLYGAFAYEPVCWVQLSVGPGYERDTGDASSGGTTASAGINVITVPARALLADEAALVDHRRRARIAPLRRER